MNDERYDADRTVLQFCGLLTELSLSSENLAENIKAFREEVDLYFMTRDFSEDMPDASEN